MANTVSNVGRGKVVVSLRKYFFNIIIVLLLVKVHIAAIFPKFSRSGRSGSVQLLLWRYAV